MDYREPDVVARSFIGTGAVAYESGKLHDGQVPGVGILNHGSDDTPATESPAGGTAGEHFGGITDGIGADGAESVAAVKNQLAPPIQRDCSQSPLRMIVVMIASQKRAARIRFERGFMVFERNQLLVHGRSKPKETHLVNSQQQKGCKGENRGRMRRYGKGEGNEGNYGHGEAQGEDWEAPQNPFH
jgi:hypothetical protein